MSILSNNKEAVESYKNQKAIAQAYEDFIQTEEYKELASREGSTTEVIKEAFKKFYLDNLDKYKASSKPVAHVVDAIAKDINRQRPNDPDLKLSQILAEFLVLLLYFRQKQIKKRII